VNEGPFPQTCLNLGDTDVRSTKPVPSAFMSSIEPQVSPGTLSWNTIFVPSGDQDGNQALRSWWVKRRHPVPFGLIVEISDPFPRSIANAIRPFLPGNAAFATGALSTSVSDVETTAMMLTERFISCSLP
jgi:hypothetical protein